MKGDGKIGYILLVEFKNSEKFILDEIMTMLNVYSGEGISETNNRNISFHGIAVYPDQRRILAADKEVFLSHYEFDVFLHLAQHPRQVFTKEQIYEAVWKLRKYTDREYIQTVWGVGYKFDPGT